MLKWKGGGTDIGAIKPETEDEVIDAYAKNPVRADAQRRGKPIELAGQIATIGKDPDGAYVEMVGRKKGLADHRIRAFVDAGDALSMDRLAKAEKGQRCMFACDKCDGWDDVMLVQLRDCAIECK